MFRSKRLRRASSLFGLLYASAWVVLSAGAGGDDGLVLYFPFEGDDNDQITDMSGAENHGEFSADMFPAGQPASRASEGKFGKALEFVTHMDGALIPASPSLAVTNDGEGFTVSLWAYPIVWNFEGPGENRAVYHHMQYNVDFFRGGGRFHVFQDGWPGINGMPEMPLETWTHTTATWSVDEGSKLYRDGVKIGAAAGTAGEIGEFSAWTVLGLIDFHKAYIGRMDGLRIYNRAVDEDEVEALFALEPEAHAVSPEGRLATMWSTITTSL